MLIGVLFSQNNNQAFFSFPSFSDSPFVGIWTEQWECDSITLNFTINDLPQNKLFPSENQNVKLIVEVKNFLNKLIWLGCVNVFCMLISAVLWNSQFVGSEVLFVVYVYFCSINWLDVWFYCSKDFVICQYVVGVPLKVVSLVNNNLVVVSQESDLSFVRTQESLMLGECDSGVKISSFELEMSQHILLGDVK